MWRTHPWTLAHFTGASVLRASLAWPCPRNSTGSGPEHLLTTRYVGTGSRVQLAAHPAGLHTPRAGISPLQGGWSGVSTGSSLRQTDAHLAQLLHRLDCPAKSAHHRTGQAGGETGPSSQAACQPCQQRRVGGAGGIQLPRCVSPP